MDYLHEMKHIHRDLAGRNVLIDSKGRAKVADFGLSRFVDIDTSNYYQVMKKMNCNIEITNEIEILWHHR